MGWRRAPAQGVLRRGHLHARPPAPSPPSTSHPPPHATDAPLMPHPPHTPHPRANPASGGCG
eukprot:1141820-Prorocentrum_lima.AAC.1